MAWCAKIYDILNVWNDEETKYTFNTNKQPGVTTIKKLSPDFYQNSIHDPNATIIQHDSPFLEKSDSFPATHSTSKQLYNDDFSNRYE